MKAIIQRVDKSDITINNSIKRNIGKGFLVLLGVMVDDTEEDVKILAKKIANLRIFEDENGKMNLSPIDLKADIMVVSNFTLGADCTGGNRPYFSFAEHPSKAEPLYNKFIDEIKKYPLNDVQTGEFGADMSINLINDGPVTIILDTNDLKKK